MTTWNATYRGGFGVLRVTTEMQTATTAGATSYWLNDEEISRDEAQQIVNQWHLSRTPIL